MPTMSTETSGGETYWVLSETNEGTSVIYSTHTFNVSNFDIIDKRIKYTFTVTNTSSLCGTTIPTGENKSIDSSRYKGWYFASTSVSPDVSVTSPSGYSYFFDIQPKSPTSTIFLSTNDKSCNKDILLRTYLDTEFRMNSSNIISVFIPNKAFAIIRATTWGQSNSTLLHCGSSSSDYICFVPRSSSETLHVEAVLKSGSTVNYTRGVPMSGDTTLRQFYNKNVGYVARYGTGSPGSPYSYSGSIKAKLMYKKANTSSWSSSSESVQMSGVTGYNANVYTRIMCSTSELTPILLTTN